MSKRTPTKSQLSLKSSPYKKSKFDTPAPISILEILGYEYRDTDPDYADIYIFEHDDDGFGQEKIAATNIKKSEKILPLERITEDFAREIAAQNLGLEIIFSFAKEIGSGASKISNEDALRALNKAKMTHTIIQFSTLQPESEFIDIDEEEAMDKMRQRCIRMGFIPDAERAGLIVVNGGAISSQKIMLLNNVEEAKFDDFKNHFLRALSAGGNFDDLMVELSECYAAKEPDGSEDVNLDFHDYDGDNLESGDIKKDDPIIKWIKDYVDHSIALPTGIPYNNSAKFAFLLWNKLGIKILSVVDEVREKTVRKKVMIEGKNEYYDYDNFFLPIIQIDTKEGFEYLKELEFEKVKGLMGRTRKFAKKDVIDKTWLEKELKKINPNKARESGIITKIRARYNEVRTDKVRTDKVRTDKVRTDKVRTDKVRTNKLISSELISSEVISSEVISLELQEKWKILGYKLSYSKKHSDLGKIDIINLENNKTFLYNIKSNGSIILSLGSLDKETIEAIAEKKDGREINPDFFIEIFEQNKSVKKEEAMNILEKFEKQPSPIARPVASDSKLKKVMRSG